MLRAKRTLTSCTCCSFQKFEYDYSEPWHPTTSQVVFMCSSMQLLSFLHKGILQSLHWKVVWLYSVSPSFVRYLRQIKQFWCIDLPAFLPCIIWMSVTVNLWFLSLSVIRSKMEALSAYSPVKASRLSFCRLDRTINFLQRRSENYKMSMSV